MLYTLIISFARINKIKGNIVLREVGGGRTEGAGGEGRLLQRY